MVDVWLLSGQEKARVRSNTDDLMSIDQTKTVITEEADKLMVCEIFKAESNQQFVNSEREKVGILLKGKQHRWSSTAKHTVYMLLLPNQGGERKDHSLLMCAETLLHYKIHFL